MRDIILKGIKSVKTDILGIRFDNVTRAEALVRVVDYLDDEGFTRTVVTPNPEMVMEATHNPAFGDILNLANLCVPDGIGIVIASKLLGGGLPQRVAGIELIEAVFERMSVDGQTCTVFLLGGKPAKDGLPSVAERAKQQLERRYSAARVVGAYDGYFDGEREKLIVEQIGKVQPDLLLVGLGFPKQEMFIDKYRAVLNARVCIGCGGSLDVFAGEVTRAPLAFRRLGLEWLYRLIKQPSRFGRMLVLPIFILRVIAYKYKTGRQA